MEAVIKETIELLTRYADSIKDCNTVDDKFSDADAESDYEYHLSLINSLENIIGEGDSSEWQNNDLAEYVYSCPECGWMGTSDEEMVCEDCGEAHEVECPECYEANLFLRCISFGGCVVEEDGCNCDSCRNKSTSASWH